MAMRMELGRIIMAAVVKKTKRSQMVKNRISDYPKGEYQLDRRYVHALSRVLPPPHPTLCDRKKADAE